LFEVGPAPTTGRYLTADRRTNLWRCSPFY
jgi:hypothetical protein